MSAPGGISWAQWKREQCCARKIRHATWEDARLAGLQVWLENPKAEKVNPATPYPCAVIGEPHYHCGHLYVRPERTRSLV